MSDEREDKLAWTRCPPADGYEVFQWPEFQALCKRLGIDTSKPIKSMTFHIREGQSVSAVITYSCRDMGESCQPTASIKHC